MKYQDNVEEIYNELAETFKKKNEDYGDSFKKSIEKYGYISALTRISDKFNRVEHLIMSSGLYANYESLEDSLKDLANYCIMTVAIMQEDKEKENNYPNNKTPFDND